MAVIVKSLPNYVSLEGHTNALPTSVKDYEDNLPVYEVKDYHNGVEFNDKTNKLSNIKQSVFKQDMW